MLVNRRRGWVAGAAILVLGLAITGQAAAVTAQDTISTVLGTGVAGMEASAGHAN